MHRSKSALSLSALALGISAAIAPSSKASGAVLYSSINPATQTTLYTVTDSSDNGFQGTGDDYYIGTGNVVLTGLSFYGGLSDTRDQVDINFYNSAGQYMADLTPTANPELQGVGLHTLEPGDFIQNGVTGVTIPGSGYIIFSPVSYSGATVSANGTITPYQGDPNPTIQIGYGGLTTLGGNNTALAAQVSSSSALTPGLYAPGTASVPQVAEFTLSDSSVPEPASLALLLPLTMLFRRSRASV